MAKKRSTEIKVGIFMMVTLGAMILLIATLTSKTQLFKTTYTLHTSFSNIAGMIPGSEVRLSGINIGMVKEIRFSDVEGETIVFISLKIDGIGMRRIMKNSKAMIQTSGLLGKKYVEIMPGTLEAGRVEDGDFIESEEPISLTEAMDKGGKILDNIADTATYLKDFIGSLRGVEGKGTDMSRAITHARNLLGEIQNGRGVLHTLIYDKEKATIIKDLAMAAKSINEITEEIKTGQGTAHDVIYGANGKELVANLAESSKAIASIVGEVKQGNGFLHSMIYEEDKSDLINELKLAAVNLREITEKIQRGEGTIGALLLDPTIYEDIRKITGEVERSTILKAYIRYTIRKNESGDTDKLDSPDDTDWGDREG